MPLILCRRKDQRKLNSEGNNKGVSSIMVLFYRNLKKQKEVLGSIVKLVSF